jgi:hypothetical protein
MREVVKRWEGGMRVLHYWPEETRRREARTVVAAAIEVPGRPRRSLWYEVPEGYERHIPATCDPQVIGAVFLFMQTGFDVRVHGQVSPSLLRNLTEFQAAWASMQPGLTSVEICADDEREYEPPNGRSGALVTFSGGVDSCFTAYRHARSLGLRFPRPLAGAVMVHGFDIPLDEPGPFASAVERSRRMVSSIDLELITIATNYKAVVADWPHSHGAAIASCLAMFGGGFSEGLIGQTFTYPELRHVVEGVNALTDPLLSSESFRIVPDGAAFERADKIRALSGWVEFMRDVRVCWQGPDRDRNCCVCEKCMRNILTFRALGLGLPPCFDHDVSEEQIRAFWPGEEIRAEIRYGGLARLAEASGATGPWVRTLERRLASARRLQHSRLLRVLQRPRYYAGRALTRLRRQG